MRDQPFTIWTRPEVIRCIGEVQSGESGWTCVRGLSIMWRTVRAIVGSRHTLIVPFGSGTRTYLPAARD